MDILNAAARAGVVLKKVATTKGGEYAGACPACGGSDRFRVWPADKGGGGSYWCRMCNKGGDLVQFLKDHCGYEWKDAFAAAGREMPQDYRPAGYRPAGVAKPQVFEPRRYDPPVETWQIRAQDLVDKSHAVLLQFARGMEWLAGRGLDEKAVRHFRLGWFAGENNQPQMFRPRGVWGLPDIFKDNGKKKMLWIPRGFVIPCFEDGAVYRIQIRRPGGDLKKAADIKYYNIPGSSMAPLAINMEKKTIVIVETVLDAMLIARHAGSLCGVVAIIASRNKPSDIVFYHLKKAHRIMVSLDHDEAGQNAWPWWEEQFKTAKLWPVPQGKDPGEAFEKGVDIKDWIRLGLPPADILDDQPGGYDPPAGLYPIDELKLLLATYPVTIRATKDAAEVIFDPGFKNRAIRHRVNDLFFKDMEVHWYLRMYHPETIITGANCEVQKAG